MRRDGGSSLPDRRPSDRRFGPAQRLRRGRDYKTVLSSGIRLNAQVVTIIARPNGGDQPRLGLAVSRRVARRAVVRHRLKRQIRESFRHHSGRLTGLDVVVIAKSGVEAMDSARLRGVLERAWKRAVDRVRRTRQLS